MDRVTRGHLETFRSEQSLPSNLAQNTLFEHFGNYCIVANQYEEEFDISNVHTGGEDDLGIDGIATFVNGILISTPEEAEAFLSLNKYLEVSFVFIQSKTSASFDGRAMTSFADGVIEFFDDESTWRMNDTIKKQRKIMNWVYTQTAYFRKGKPSCELHYISQGKWVDDQNLLGRITRRQSEIEDLLLFDSVVFKPHGAEELQDLWTKSKNSLNASFELTKRITLGATSGVVESHLGVISINEFLKIVSDQQGIRRGIFIDNVRDFQGDNPINSQIAGSLGSEDGRDRFAVLNNGITLVARELNVISDRFVASDIQIVNGCQTSHVLYNSRHKLDESTEVPIKVIATDDEDVISSIATATNSQTVVKEEDLWALDKIHKRIEQHFSSYEGKKSLFYERRSRQYAGETGIEKVRIIPKSLAARSFAAMFRNDPHRATRYYSSLKAAVGFTIFAEDHALEPYYTSSYAYYRLEYFFRNGQIDVKYKPARYHLMMLFRLLSAAHDVPSMNSKYIKSYTEAIDQDLWSDKRAPKIFGSACDIVNSVQNGKELTGEDTKVQSFTDRIILASSEWKASHGCE